ncbi:hypothetical protein XELAEV_18018818mg [Xenopus laevis]|uniref:NAD(P)(+)--arginine ADP-ribosyltransferase n=1 Tax=Xenopus laevis TaxID=8355 RepID=A0A974DEW7_XENLA|nr:hypothetical protein XELAEV_18018818mg [Xenopus laevis]
MGTGNPAISINCTLALISTLALIRPCEGDKRFRRDASQEIVLDMAASSYDDRYLECTEAMDSKIPGILHDEQTSNEEFAIAWEDATDEWQNRKGDTEIPPGFKDEYAISILAYTNDNPDIYRSFNAAVRQAGQSRDFYLNNFHFKALHYYLARVLQLLRESTPQDYSVYRGVNGFTSSSTDENKTLKFGNDTFFTITTGYGVTISEFSFFDSETEVLIPPFEKFTVTDFSTESNKNKITLQSNGIYSKYNCVLLEKTGKVQLRITACVFAPPLHKSLALTSCSYLPLKLPWAPE